MIKKLEVMIFWKWHNFLTIFILNLLIITLWKKIIYGLSHKIDEFSGKWTIKQANLVENQLPSLPGYLPLGTQVQNEAGIPGYLGNPGTQG